MATTASSFPLEARVILDGLVKAPDLNGKLGVVKSKINSNGRQTVYVEELSKSVALKTSNLRYQPMEIDSLSVKDLKTLLKYKKVDDSELAGMDKSELQSKVANLVSESPEEIAQVLATANAPKPMAAPTNNTFNPSSMNMSQAASQLENMSPDQLRQQARMMRSMDPATIRRMNPQLAGMSDAQIRMAASQMEMMADNPQMMKMAANQVKNMSPQDLQNLQNGMGNNNATIPTPSTNKQQQQQQQNIMGMSPDQIKQQAEMLKTMDPDSIRRMNPQFQNMTDAQIKMAAGQFEMMADNPELLKQFDQQMKDMTPEQMESLKNNFTPGSSQQQAPPNLEDATKMVENMDKGQLKEMMKMVRKNPEMLKQFASMTGVSQETFQKQMGMFDQLSDDQLDKVVDVMLKVQKAKGVWSKINAKTGGHLLKILVVMVVVGLSLIVKRVWFSSAAGSVPNPLDNAIPNIVAESDEFETEF